MSEKKLRDALRKITGIEAQIKSPGEYARLFGYCKGIAKDALADAGEPEMLRLLRWLHERKAWEEKTKPGAWLAYSECLGRVIQCIKKDFGYRLEDHDGQT